MITVPQATEKIIKRSRYLSEAMSKDLINASSLARYIRPEVEIMVFKKVTEGSILMAIQRLQRVLSTTKKPSPFIPEPPDMIVRSNLALFYVKNSPTLLSNLMKVEQESAQVQKKALFTYGRAETLILANKMTSLIIHTVLQNETITKEFKNVSAITIHVSETSVTTPGILNLFIKSLAWEGINLLGLLTTETEITLTFANKDSNSAFSILQSLFTLE